MLQGKAVATGREVALKTCTPTPGDAPSWPVQARGGGLLAVAKPPHRHHYDFDQTERRP